MAKKSRDKGGRGERAAAKEFRPWWGTDFARTPGSGGFATQRFRDDWNAAGDLVTPDPTFPFCVEVKWVEDWTLEQLLRNDGCLVYQWWQQVQGECPQDKLPLLVFKKNQHPFYCMIEADHMASEKFLSAENVRYFELPLTKAQTGVYPMRVYIMLLSDFFKLEPDVWRAHKDRLTTQRLSKLDYPSQQMELFE